MILRALKKCSLALVLIGCNAIAALDENSAVSQGLAQPDIQTLLDARQQQAAGDVSAAGRWENPEFEYEQDNLSLPGGDSRETTLWLRQPLDLAGVKRLQRNAAEQGLTAERLGAQLERRQWVATIRQRFHTALAAQLRSELTQRHHQRLQQIGIMIEQRIAKGEASRYDSLRLAQEIAHINSEYGSAVAETTVANQQLFSLIGVTAQPLEGELLPPSVPIKSAVSIKSAHGDLAQHPRIAALAAHSQQATLNAQAARREAWPTLTLGLGHKTVDEPGLDTDGYALALGIKIPLFDRGQGRAQSATALSRQLQAETALATRQLESDIHALHVQLAAQRESALAFRQAAQADERSLSAIAESSYQAGEIGIMELIDAYDAEQSTGQRYIDSALAARLTYIQLRQLENRE